MKLLLWLARLLMLRPGEGRVMLFLYPFTLIAGFGLSIGQVSSDALFFKLYGMEYLPHMYALIAVVLVPASLAYAAFVDRLTPHRLFVYMLVGICATVGLAWLIMVSAGNPGIALYFVAYGVISELLLTHIYLYVASFFDAQQAKRLLPSAMGVFLAGRIGGGFFVGMAGTAAPIQHTALVWTLTLLVLVGLLLWRHRGEPSRCLIKRGHATSPVLMLREGLMFARASRLARITAAGMFLLVMVLSIQEYVAGMIFVKHFTDERELAAFFGWLSAWTNVGVLATQMLLFSRLSRRFGLKTMNMVFPVSSILTLGLMAVSPVFTAAVLGRINSRGILSGFRNNVAGLFYQALPGYMQGRVRALITGLVLPVGLLAAALFLWLVPQDAPLEWIAAGGFVTAIALFWVKLRKNDAYRESLVEMVGDSVFAEDSDRVADLGGLDRETAFKLADQMRRTETLALMDNYADMLELLAREHAGAAMLEVYPDLPPRLQDPLLSRIARLAPPGWEKVAWETARHGDTHLLVTTSRLLIAAHYPAVTERAAEWLETGKPRLRASIAAGCLQGENPSLKPRSLEVLQELLNSSHPDDYLSALGALAAMPHPDLMPLVRPMLVYENIEARALALAIWSRCSQTRADEAIEIIDWALSDPSHKVRAAAVRAAARLPFADLPVLDWLSRAMQDCDYRVRATGREYARPFMPQSPAAWLETLSRRESDFELQSVMISELSASDIDTKDDILRQVSAWNMRLARKKLLILQNFSSQGEADEPALMLLKQVLSEESRRHLDLVLQILGCLDQSRQMSFIRAGLASQNRQLWAQALESALQLRKEAHVFRELAVLFEAEREGVALPGEPPGGRHAFATWLTWCQEHGSDWLAECARYCLDNKRFAS
jgi:hypothetical protein